VGRVQVGGVAGMGVDRSGSGHGHEHDYGVKVGLDVGLDVCGMQARGCAGGTGVGSHRRRGPGRAPLSVHTCLPNSNPCCALNARCPI
jgi:hypothetical protein